MKWNHRLFVRLNLIKRQWLSLNFIVLILPAQAMIYPSSTIDASNATLSTGETTTTIVAEYDDGANTSDVSSKQDGLASSSDLPFVDRRVKLIPWGHLTSTYGGVFSIYPGTIDELNAYIKGAYSGHFVECSDGYSGEVTYSHPGCFRLNVWCHGYARLTFVKERDLYTENCPPDEYPEYIIPSYKGDKPVCIRPTLPSCYFPFTADSSNCVLDCPPGKSFSATQGRCIADQSQVPEQQQCEGNPVSIQNGEKIQAETPDIAIHNGFPLFLQRTYYSFRAPEAAATHNKLLFAAQDEGKQTSWTHYSQPADYTGPQTNQLSLLATVKLSGNVPIAGQKQWANNFDFFLNLSDATQPQVVQPDSSTISFELHSDNSYSPAAQTAARLASNADSSLWTFRDTDNTQYLFAASGLLTHIINPTGLSQSLTYDASNQLTQVEDDFGNQLSFTYVSGFLTSVSASSGDAVAYEYDQYGNLTKVTKTPAAGQATIRQYHYEDSRFPYALTGITDEKGVLYATWTYDDVGRATQSVHVGEVDKTTFAYATDSTTVTNPLGKSDVYHYATTGGARRLVSVEGQASTSCLAANQAYSYYDNGLLKSKTDQQGRVTQYEYNSRGLVTKLVEAVGTADERTTTTQWHATLPLPIQVTQGDRVVSYDYDDQGRLLARHIGN